MMCDYISLLNSFNKLDENEDGVLSKEEFLVLADEMKLCHSAEYMQIAAHGLYQKENDGIPFANIRAFYEAEIIGPKCKLMGIILFRGIDDDSDSNLTEDQFKQYVKLINPKVSDEDLKLYQSLCDPGDTKIFPYHLVSKFVLGKRVPEKSSPFQERLIILSPHSACCNLI